MKFLTIVAMLFVLTGCADHTTFEQAASMERVGFWYGLWHGIIIIPAFIISLFDDSTAIYAIYNNGGWYNFGFLIGVLSKARVTVTLTQSASATNSRRGRR